MATLNHSKDAPTEDAALAATSTADLVREAVGEARELIRLEVALAKTEIRDDLREAKAAGIAFGVAVVLAMLGLVLLLVGVALAISATAAAPLVSGGVLIAGAGIAGFVGAKALPTKPLDRTQRRLKSDIDQLKERLA